MAMPSGCSSSSVRDSSAPCPICNVSFALDALDQHANQCIDSFAENDDIPSPPSSSASSPESSPRSSKLDAGLQPLPRDSKSGEEITPIFDWLGTIGLGKYASGLLLAGYRTLDDVRARPPTDAFLRDNCGVKAMGPRRKLLSALSRLPPAKLPDNPNEKSELKTLTESNSAAHTAISSSTNPTDKKDSTTSATAPKRKVWAIFEPGYRAKISPPKRPRSAHITPSTRDKRDRRASGDNGATSSGTKRYRKHSFSHRVAGTSFTVDSFQAAKSDPGCTQFFLTHFHSDHYGGLRKKTFPAGARVICSAITARLVRSLLRIPDSFIRVLPMSKKVDFPDAGFGSRSGASVWAFDANHCPGAVILLFHVWSTGRYILHCGDCRYDPVVFNQHEKLVEVIQTGELDILHLDTTYCNPSYAFPHQTSVLNDVVDIARREDARTRKRCLFFFGTYSIGKEKVFLAVARGLDLHIFAGKRKRAILDALDLGPDYTNRIVDTPNQARVQVVSMFDLRPGKLGAYAQRNGLNTDFIGRGLAILFRPTGWSFTGSSETPKSSCRPADNVMFYNIPYSEHSSFDELRNFVAWARPARLIPTVNARSNEDADKMRSDLGHVDRTMRHIDVANARK